MPRQPCQPAPGGSLLDDSVRGRIGRLAASYPRRRSALIPVLDLLHRAGGGTLGEEEVAEAAPLLGMTAGEAWSAATSYPLFDPRPTGRWHLDLDNGVPALLAGAPAVARRLSRILGIPPGGTTRDGLFSFSLSRDIGAADVAPAIRVADRVYGPMDREKTEALVSSLRSGRLPAGLPSLRTWSSCSLLLGGPGGRPTADLSSYRAAGGYRALARARRMKAGAIIAAVARSGLRGRGGADFPTAAKWRSLASPGPVYLICNADEGEPGSFKDRILVEERPHAVIEGVAIAARAIGAGTCFIYLRGTYRRAAALLGEAIAAAGDAGLLDGLSIIVHLGAGSYICGEETALIASLEGRRGVPSSKPPYPAQRGLYGKPTIVNNVETLAALPLILGHGPGLFRRTSPRLFSVSGHVHRPGLYECPEGTPLDELIDAAGGVRGTLKGLFLGGISQPVLTATEVSALKLDGDSCRQAGSGLGSGTVIVMNTHTPTATVARRMAEFFAAESCGQCAPCRDGLARIHDGLRLSGSAARQGALMDEIRTLGDTLRDLPFCPAGRWSLRSLSSLTEKFPRDFP